ncbi:uncharacterized protein LOC143178916 isoform X2 [Calliopsis andreniformis]|uniref:uncharacterized protein LOC143178916 isoform X2 n=1 Tax=Calliopsis andreniformis TaxID=337506 RepID=UPI003FCCF101
MDTSGVILNLVQKATIKTEINEKNLSSCELNNHDDSPPPKQSKMIKNSFSCNLPTKPCEDCKKGKIDEPMFRVSLMTNDEDLECDKENGLRKKIRVEAKQVCRNREKCDEEEKIFVLQQLGRSQIRPEELPAFLCIDGRIADSSGVKRKIPRPANAFMLFANEWRKKLAAENPRESNKDISVRLGILWKNMTKDVKEKYFALAREVDAEHKRKYPDYVYNPKEARLRKAMREQSRELSRRSILQSAIARAGVIAGPVASAGFLDHQHRFGCVSTAGLPISSPVESDRVAEPWFQAQPRTKPIHSPRMTDWYGNVTDPIGRLQVMGTMHQRGLDKCKDPIRSQAGVVTAADCGTNFSNSGYSVDFNDLNRERDLRRQENIAEYAEFTEGQKWHPYQNGGNAHQHPRSPHPSQMGGILHPNVQSPSSHGPGPWGQFCHGVLPHAPAMPRNIGVRGPRHTVLLRDRLSGRHCGFPEESARLAYAPNKLDVDNVRGSYSSPEHQMPRLLESSVDSIVDAAPSSRARREDEGPRWEPNAINNGISMDNLTTTTQESSVVREKEREPRRPIERFEPKKKTVSKQPLPGFHQAFGSTEIGRFSRSEFFVNMVGESGGTVDVVDAENTNLHPKTYLSAPVIFPFSPRSCGILGASTAIHRIAENGEILSRIIPDECCWFTSQSRCGVSRMSDNVVNCTAFLDCSHRARDKEWFCQSNTVIHPSGMQALLRQREHCESFVNERSDGNYIVIGAPGNGSLNNIGSITDEEFANEARKQATLKMQEDGSPKHSDSSARNDGND